MPQIKFKSIFIKGKTISLQVKLYEVELTLTDERPRRNGKTKSLLIGN